MSLACCTSGACLTLGERDWGDWRTERKYLSWKQLQEANGLVNHVKSNYSSYLRYACIRTEMGHINPAVEEFRAFIEISRGGHGKQDGHRPIASKSNQKQSKYCQNNRHMKLVWFPTHSSLLLATRFLFWATGEDFCPFQKCYCLNLFWRTVIPPLHALLALWGSGRQITNQGQTSGDLSGIPSCEKEGTPAEGMLTCSSTCCLLHLEKSP